MFLSGLFAPAIYSSIGKTMEMHSRVPSPTKNVTLNNGIFDVDTQSSVSFLRHLSGCIADPFRYSFPSIVPKLRLKFFNGTRDGKLLDRLSQDCRAKSHRPKNSSSDSGFPVNSDLKNSELLFFTRFRNSEQGMRRFTSKYFPPPRFSLSRWGWWDREISLARFSSFTSRKKKREKREKKGEEGKAERTFFSAIRCTTDVCTYAVRASRTRTRHTQRRSLEFHAWRPPRARAYGKATDKPTRRLRRAPRMGEEGERPSLATTFPARVPPAVRAVW